MNAGGQNHNHVRCRFCFLNSSTEWFFIQQRLVDEFNSSLEDTNGTQSARPRLSRGNENLQVHQDTESLPPPSSSHHTSKDLNQLLKDLHGGATVSLPDEGG